MPPATDTDPFDELRARIRSTADAAERLSFEAFDVGAGENGGGERSRARATEDAAQETQALIALVALLRDLLPDELRRQVAELVRQVLVLLRAIIDYSILRLEPGPEGERPGPPPVQDIPLD
jgi:hypothetical protein